MKHPLYLKYQEYLDINFPRSYGYVPVNKDDLRSETILIEDKKVSLGYFICPEKTKLDRELHEKQKAKIAKEFFIMLIRTPADEVLKAEKDCFGSQSILPHWRQAHNL